MDTKKTKVAVLGGGAGAMAAAFALTATPSLRQRFEVTVHQVGWRLGGKAASGRGGEAGQRVEERGPHVLLGMYDHTLGLVRACYEELDRPEGAPLATFRDALAKQSYAVVMCKLSGDSAHDGGWFPWTFRFPVNDAAPGEAAAPAAPWALFRVAVEWLWSLWGASEEVRALLEHAPAAGEEGRSSAGGAPAPWAREVPAWIEEALAKIEKTAAFAPIEHPLVGHAFAPHDAPDTGRRGLGRLVAAIRNAVRALPESPSEHDAGSHHLLTWLLRKLMDDAWHHLAPFVPTEPWAYKLWVTINLAGSMAVGFLSDGVLFHGFESIDHRDFVQWLSGHGANEVTIGSGPVRAVHDAVFAYVNGDRDKPNIAAGTCLRALLRALTTYRGSVFYHLAAGAGDTVFAPLYEVLRRRGVKFQFFHRVAGIGLSPDRKSVGAIEILQQVKLRGGGYEPLVDVDGLPCWPAAPLADQIAGGDELALSGVDLESPYSAPWRDQRRRTLIAGLDFDQVVLALPIGVIPYVAPDLVMESRAFGSMIANVGTVQTASFQLWLGSDLAELGWSSPPGVTERPLAAAYVEPMGAWSDMTHLARFEAWPEGGTPRTLAYFSGSLPQLGPTSPFTDTGFPARQRARVVSLSRKLLENDVGRLWPLATKSQGHGFRWDRVISQHHRANVDPADLYVLSVAGSSRFRLRAGESGFENLVLAGDWVRTSLDVGCIEAAVEGGLLAAAAILGEAPARSGQ